MKNSTIIILLLISVFSYSQTQTNGCLKSEITTSFELKYILQKPQNTNELKPLIVFLHGSGEKGNDLEKIKIHGPLKYIQTHTLDAYILAPQCSQDKYWETEELYQLIEKTIKENKIDASRVYLTGLSMGAWGSWNLAYAHPEMFAALVPISGYVDRVPIIENCKIALIPIRIFHNQNDNVVDVYYSKTIYNLLKECCKDIKLEIFDGIGHDSWTRVYNNPEIYEWLFKQQRLK